MWPHVILFLSVLVQMEPARALDSLESQHQHGHVPMSGDENFHTFHQLRLIEKLPASKRAHILQLLQNHFNHKHLGQEKTQKSTEKDDAIMHYAHKRQHTTLSTSSTASPSNMNTSLANIVSSLAPTSKNSPSSQQMATLQSVESNEDGAGDGQVSETTNSMNTFGPTSSSMEYTTSPGPLTTHVTELNNTNSSQNNSYTDWETMESNNITLNGSTSLKNGTEDASAGSNIASSKKKASKSFWAVFGLAMEKYHSRRSHPDNDDDNDVGPEKKVEKAAITTRPPVILTQPPTTPAPPSSTITPINLFNNKEFQERLKMPKIDRPKTMKNWKNPTSMTDIIDGHGKKSQGLADGEFKSFGFGNLQKIKTKIKMPKIHPNINVRKPKINIHVRNIKNNFHRPKVHMGNMHPNSLSKQPRHGVRYINWPVLKGST